MRLPKFLNPLNIIRALDPSLQLPISPHRTNGHIPPLRQPDCLSSSEFPETAARQFGEQLKESIRARSTAHAARLLRDFLEPFAPQTYDEPRHHIVTAALLLEVQEMLLTKYVNHPMRNFDEEFVYISGFKAGTCFYIWQKLCPVEYASQSAAGVAVDKTSGSRVLSAMKAEGQFFVGHVHSHPGIGRNANHRSLVDRNFVESLVAGPSPSPAIGAIFSRGESSNTVYLRFYAAQQLPFHVTIIGPESVCERIPSHENDYSFRLNIPLAAKDHSHRRLESHLR